MSEPDSITRPVAATIRDVLRDTNHENNWPEDAAHENGNYYNKCNSCKQPFIGHTRRACCRKCYVANQASEVETSTIPTELLEAYVELLRAGQRELDEAEFLPGTNFENAILQVIRAGGGK